MNPAPIVSGAHAPQPSQTHSAPPARHPLRLALAARRRQRADRIWAMLRRARPGQQNMRDFLLAYCACFVAAIAFIS